MFGDGATSHARSSGFGVRPASVSDAEGIAVTHVAAWRTGYAGQLPEGFLAGLSVEEHAGFWTRALARRTDASTGTLVAASGDFIAGFASFGPSRNVGCDVTVGELFVLNTHPGFWGDGIGTALHNGAISQLAAAGFTRATLWVLSSNVRARRFYEHRDWSLDGRQKTEWRGDVRLDETQYERAKLG